MSAQDKSVEATIRARIDPELKEAFELWCNTKQVPASQVLRWLIVMHLKDPNKLWEWLSGNEEDTV